MSAPATSQALPHKEAMNQSGYGMTLRQYFAGQALVGILSNNELTRGLSDISQKQKGRPSLNVLVAEVAASMAEALLAELEKKA